MGLIKFKKRTINYQWNFIKKLKNPKIHMTSFLNLLIKIKLLT